jgi:hypothetical protein
MRDTKQALIERLLESLKLKMVKKYYTEIGNQIIILHAPIT